MRKGVAVAGAAGLPVVNQVLQHTLRSLCGQPHEDPQFWVYSIFWRILPRNYPPPKWDDEAGPFERNKGNKRNWILVWEDGYCDFVACSSSRDCKEGKCEEEQHGPLQPELFFKMSHDVYNYGEGLMGKIASERSHKWIFRDPTEQDNVTFISSWQASADSYPRTWEAQFKAGIQTIAIIAVGEGLLQLGSTKKVIQDVDFVLMLQRKFNYLQSIPGVFAQTKMTRAVRAHNMSTHHRPMEADMKLKPLSGLKRAAAQEDNHNEDDEACSTFPMLPLVNLAAPLNLASPAAAGVPAMYNSLQALLSKLPAVTPNVRAGTAKVDLVPAAVNASAKASSPMITTSSSKIGCSHVSGPTLLPMNLWPADSHRALVCPPLPPLASNPGLPNPSDEFESYHCLFGQPIS